LLSLIFVPIVLLASAWFYKRMTVLYDNYQNQDGTLSATLQENLSGVRVVRAFARQAYEVDKFERDNRSKYDQGKRLLMMSALYWPITDVICFTQVLGIFYLGAQMTMAGTITIGTYMAFVNIIGWLVWPVRNLGRIVAEGSKALVSYHRVARIIEETREETDEGSRINFDEYGIPDINAELVFDRVSFAYEEDKPVLDEISFTAKPGETIALLGSTGSGKTSLVNLLPRFYEYTGGSLKLDGVELRDYAVRDLRRIIGTVEQEPFLFSRTIRDNIAYGVNRNVDDEEIEVAARIAAIHDVIMTFPNGYDTLVGEKGVTLSGGQKQRLAIARTMLKDPRILVLDDSTSAVDTETEATIRGILNLLMQGRTTFVIAHRIQTVMSADQILVLDKGQIVQHGTHEELVVQPGLYRDIYDIQSKIETQVKQETDVIKNTNKEEPHVGLPL
ncbi:MAG: ABC transporter ATP-binding protein, partial [Pseudomonadota bacterium]